MSGETLSGFAHGVAGMVYFLAEYDRRFGCPQARQAWMRGADWLLARGVSSGQHDALTWEYSDRNKERWRWWCHGSPGIALGLLRLYEQTTEERFAKAAEQALRIHPPRVRAGNLSECHGLSGLGEIYLEAARVLDDEQWLERAHEIAWTLLHLRREIGSGTTWLVEDPNVPTADLMVGSSGVLHFLLRLRVSDNSIGFPLLLDPLPARARSATRSAYHFC